MSSVCGTMKTGLLQISGDSSYVQHSFSARKIVENYECRTSTERAQHEPQNTPKKVSKDKWQSI